MTKAQRKRRLRQADEAALRIEQAARNVGGFVSGVLVLDAMSGDPRHDIDCARRWLSEVDKQSARLRRHLVALRVAAGEWER